MNVCLVVPFTAKTEKQLNELCNRVDKIRKHNKTIYILGINNNSTVDTELIEEHFDGILSNEYESTAEEALDRGVIFAEDEGFDFVGWTDEYDVTSSSYFTFKSGLSLWGTFL